MFSMFLFFGFTTVDASSPAWEHGKVHCKGYLRCIHRGTVSQCLFSQKRSQWRDLPCSLPQVSLLSHITQGSRTVYFRVGPLRELQTMWGSQSPGIYEILYKSPRGYVGVYLQTCSPILLVLSLPSSLLPKFWKIQLSENQLLYKSQIQKLWK